MTNYRKINNITGWVVFAVTLMLYFFTLEPTVSLWDCGEFTAAAYKLEVGHPPGAPLYLMLGRIFSLFAPDRSDVAICINSLSALASAFTVLFLFWTITHLARKILIKDNDFSNKSIITVIAGGVIGSLTFAFSDSFWFSAVEAEVYALSSLFTALVFWCILKWEDDTGKYSNRWIILLAYLMGLSIGVHLLNLLAIPVIVLIYYFRTRKFSWMGFWKAFMLSGVILFAVLYLIIPGTIQLAAFFEIVCINNFNLPLNSGLIIFVVTVVIVLYAFLHLSLKHEAVRLNTAILCLTVILLGYGSYAMILIRAQANTPLNTGNPSQTFALLSYLNRDQYGNSPLFYGQYYNAPKTVVDSERKDYTPVNGKYVAVHPKKTYVYDTKFKTLFPRMYSPIPDHIQVYKDWGSVSGKPVEVKEPNGSSGIIMKPTFRENVQFFLSYQVGYMYLRYFLWNFAGKQNDMQGNGGILKGNWISGFDFLDRMFIGSQEKLPDYMKKNPGRNRYFLMPLLLGILGMIFQYRRSRKYFGMLLLLFVMTGFAIVVFTNQTPLQPRERDYIYVGSFYVFAIWIGLGAMWLVQLVSRIIKKEIGFMTGIAATYFVPILMFSQNLDDHDRHGRFAARDIAFNYLNSCDKDAILFTAGDNDTFPLWFLQEVEGIRTDVRVVNLSLLNAPWYADQMKRKVYQSEAIRCQIPYTHPDLRDWILIDDLRDSSISAKDAVLIFARDTLRSDDYTLNNYLPTREIKVEAFRTIQKYDTIPFSLPGSYLSFSQIATLDIIAAAGKERPVYFTAASEKENLGLKNYLRLDGYSYRLVAVKKDTIADHWDGQIDTGILYDKLMYRCNWDDLQRSSGLMDDHARKMLNIMHLRLTYSRLALQFATEGKVESGLKVLDRVMQIMPSSRFPYDHYCIYLAQAYYKCGSFIKGDEISRKYAKQLQKEIQYFEGLSDLQKKWIASEKATSLYCKRKLKAMLHENHRENLLKEL
jgi:hypothetical protein